MEHISSIQNQYATFQQEILSVNIVHIPTAAGVPVLVLSFNAGPVDLTWAVESSKVSAILACHFPAQSTGDAIGMVVSGQVNPAARLPYTWPASMNQVG